MATPPRTQKEAPARPMTGRTIAVAAVALVLGGLVLKQGLNRPAKISTAADGTAITIPTGNASSDGGTAKPTTTVKGASTTVGAGTATTAAPIVQTTLPAPANVNVEVLVANGAEMAGIAGRISTVLQTKGYKVLNPATNALSASSTTLVYFTAGNDRLAKLVATDLGVGAAPAALPPTLPVKDMRTAGVLVLIGTDFKEASIPATKSLPSAAGTAVTAPVVSTVAGAPAPAVTTPATTAKAGTVTTTTVKK